VSYTTSNSKLRILVVDDEPDILLGLNAVLRGQSHYVETFKEHTRRKTKVFLMTGFDISSLPEFDEALESDIVDEVLQKPIPNDKLVAIIEKSFLHNNP
jgi:DNA-binding NtrC family response regulator